MFSLQPNHRADSGWSRLLIHTRGVEGAHNYLGNSANTDLICQAKGEPGQAPEPLLPLKQKNKQYEEIRCVLQFKESIHLEVSFLLISTGFV